MNDNVNYETKVAILKGGSSSEREVSLSTGDACSEAISKLGYNVKSVSYTHLTLPTIYSV